MDLNPVGWFEIYVDDMDRARCFYEAVLGQTMEKLENSPKEEQQMCCFTGTSDSYGAGGALVKLDSIAAGGNSTIVYFSCENCAIEESRVEPNGGSVQQKKMPIGDYGFISLVKDTEGNVIGLHSDM